MYFRADKKAKRKNSQIKLHETAVRCRLLFETFSMEFVTVLETFSVFFFHFFSPGKNFLTTRMKREKGKKKFEDFFLQTDAKENGMFRCNFKRMHIVQYDELNDVRALFPPKTSTKCKENETKNGGILL